MATIVSEDEFRVWLDLPMDDPRYQFMRGVLDSAESLVAERVGVLGAGVSTTFVVHASASGALVLPASGLASVVSVTDPMGNVVSVDPAKVNLAAGIIEIPYQGSGPWTVVVTSTRDTERLRLAVLIIAGHLWETLRGRSGDRAQVYAGEPAPVPMGFAIPARALELLGGGVSFGFA